MSRQLLIHLHVDVAAGAVQVGEFRRDLLRRGDRAAVVHLLRQGPPRHGIFGDRVDSIRRDLLDDDPLVPFELEGVAVPDLAGADRRQRFIRVLAGHVVDRVFKLPVRRHLAQLRVFHKQAQIVGKQLVLGYGGGVLDLLRHAQITKGNVEVIDDVDGVRIVLKGNGIPIGHIAGVLGGGPEVVHRLFRHAVNVFEAAPLVLVQAAEQIVPVSVVVRLHRLGRHQLLLAAAPRPVQIHLHAGRNQRLRLVRQVASVRHQPLLLAADFRLLVLVRVDQREVRVVNLLHHARVAFDLFLFEGVLVRIAVLVHHVRLEEDSLPVMFLIQRHSDRFPGFLVVHDLEVARGTSHLPLHCHRDAFRTLRVMVVVVLPHLLHIDDLRHDSHFRVVVPDHRDEGERAAVLIGHLTDQTRIVVRVHVVHRVQRGIPVDILEAVCAAVRVHVGIRAFRVPRILVPVVVRRYHMQVRSPGFLALQFKIAAVRPFPQVQRDGCHVHPVRHRPQAVRAGRHPLPRTAVRYVVPAFVVEEDALVHHAARRVAELQPRLRRVINHRRAALRHKFAHVNGKQPATPLATHFDFLFIPFGAHGDCLAVPIAVPVFLGLDLVVVRLLRRVMLRAAAFRDQVVLQAVIHHHVAGDRVLCRRHAQPVRVVLSFVHVHLLLSFQSLRPDAVQIVLYVLHVFRLRHLVHRQVHVRFCVHKAFLVRIRIKVCHRLHDVLRLAVRRVVVVLPHHGVRLADSSAQRAQPFVVPALESHIVHQMAAQRVDVRPGIRRVEAQPRAVAHIAVVAPVDILLRGHRLQVRFHDQQDPARALIVVDRPLRFQRVSRPQRHCVHQRHHALRQQVVPDAARFFLHGPQLHGLTPVRHARQVRHFVRVRAVVQHHLPVLHIVVREPVKVHKLVRHSAVARARQGRAGVILPDIQVCVVLFRQEHRLVGMHVLVLAHLGAFRMVVQVHVHHVIIPVCRRRRLALREQVLHDVLDPVRRLQQDVRIHRQLRRRLVGGNARAVTRDALKAERRKIDVLGLAALHGVAAHIHPAILVHRIPGLRRRVVVQLHPQLHRRLRDAFIRYEAEGRGIEIIRRVLRLVPVEHLRRRDRHALELIVVRVCLDQLALRRSRHVLEPVPPVRRVHHVVPVQVVVRVLRPCRRVPIVVVASPDAFVQRRGVLVAVDVLPAHHVRQWPAGEDVAVAHRQDFVLHLHVDALPQPVQRHLIRVVLLVIVARPSRVRTHRAVLVRLGLLRVFEHHKASRRVLPLRPRVRRRAVRIRRRHKFRVRTPQFLRIPRVRVLLRQRPRRPVQHPVRRVPLHVLRAVCRPQVAHVVVRLRALVVPGVRQHVLRPHVVYRGSAVLRPQHHCRRRPHQVDLAPFLIVDHLVAADVLRQVRRRVIRAVHLHAATVLHVQAEVLVPRVLRVGTPPHIHVLLRVRSLRQVRQQRRRHRFRVLIEHAVLVRVAQRLFRVDLCRDRI